MPLRLAGNKRQVTGRLNGRAVSTEITFFLHEGKTEFEIRKERYFGKIPFFTALPLITDIQ